MYKLDNTVGVTHWTSTSKTQGQSNTADSTTDDILLITLSRWLVWLQQKLHFQFALMR